jgi:trk system potassium uptake protein TrkA
MASGKAVRDLKLPAECALVAVICAGQLLLLRADLALQSADEVLALVHASQIEQLAAFLGRAD